MPQGECWSGEQGNALDAFSGFAKQIGNDLMWLGGLLGSMGTLSPAQHAANATQFGSNNTNAGILGASLAPAAYVVATGGAAGAARFAGLRGGAVPGRLIIDNPKCAITRACARDPIVQRAYAECAEGYIIWLPRMLERL